MMCFVCLVHLVMARLKLWRDNCWAVLNTNILALVFGGGILLQAQAQLSTRVVFQPSSLQGGLHKKLKQSVQVNKDLKVRRVRFVAASHHCAGNWGEVSPLNVKKVFSQG
jgi:hypothetical protein